MASSTATTSTFWGVSQLPGVKVAEREAEAAPLLGWKVNWPWKAAAMEVATVTGPAGAEVRLSAKLATALGSEASSYTVRALGVTSTPEVARARRVGVGCELKEVCPRRSCATSQMSYPVEGSRALNTSVVTAEAPPGGGRTSLPLGRTAVAVAMAPDPPEPTSAKTLAAVGAVDPRGTATANTEAGSLNSALTSMEVASSATAAGVLEVKIGGSTSKNTAGGESMGEVAGMPAVSTRSKYSTRRVRFPAASTSSVAATTMVASHSSSAPTTLPGGTSRPPTHTRGFFIGSLASICSVTTFPAVAMSPCGEDSTPLSENMNTLMSTGAVLSKITWGGVSSSGSTWSASCGPALPSSSA
mmetsp:Transcript_26644/g.85432  ORF Transcript_26644/g.85432 Transcript_26644/m.85432 type:complete len:358 (-) Transcript_26644:11073-12146(-)